MQGHTHSTQSATGAHWPNTVKGLPFASPPLQPPCLHHRELFNIRDDHDVCFTMPMSFLAVCTQLQSLKLQGYDVDDEGPGRRPRLPGSLVASTILQHLEIVGCSIIAADGAADSVSWQKVFPGPGQLPHLTYLKLWHEERVLEQADIEAMVACCSNLKALCCNTLPSGFGPALARLPGLTTLQLHRANDEQCSAMVQSTGLRQLLVRSPLKVSAVGLRQLAALTQLTSLGFGAFEFDCRELDILAGHFMEDRFEDQGMLLCWYGIVNQVCVNAALQLALWHMVDVVVVVVGGGGGFHGCGQACVN